MNEVFIVPLGADSIAGFLADKWEGEPEEEEKLVVLILEEPAFCFKNESISWSKTPLEEEKVKRVSNSICKLSMGILWGSIEEDSRKPRSNKITGRLENTKAFQFQLFDSKNDLTWTHDIIEFLGSGRDEQ